MQMGDGRQLLAPDLPRPVHVPRFNVRFLLAGVGASSGAGGPHHGIDFLLV
jgi:hypothetical protein